MMAVTTRRRESIGNAADARDYATSSEGGGAAELATKSWQVGQLENDVPLKFWMV
jgi:hypothetical protein